MDKRISYKIVLDSETAPCDITFDGVSPWNSFIYDLGWQVCDKRGNVYVSRSFVNADIFLDERELMKSAYYAKKIPMYWNDIKSGKRVLTSWYKIRKQLWDDIKEYGITEVYAHNAFFDYGATANTQRWETKSKYRYFLPYGVKWCDTLKMARQTYAKEKGYQNFCYDHGYITKTGKPRLTAEIIYKYISGNYDFEECHTGLEDVDIERQIMVAIFRKHKGLKKELWNN